MRILRCGAPECTWEIIFPNTDEDWPELRQDQRTLFGLSCGESCNICWFRLKLRSSAYRSRIVLTIHGPLELHWLVTVEAPDNASEFSPTAASRKFEGLAASLAFDNFFHEISQHPTQKRLELLRTSGVRSGIVYA